MSKLLIDLSNIDLSGCNTVRQALTTLIKNDIVQTSIENMCAKIRFREYSFRDQNIDIDAVSDAIEVFLETENVKACERYLAKHLDTSEALHDLLRDVMHMNDYSPLIETLSRRAVKRFPETKKILPNVASEIVMSTIINIVRARDPSSPLDALKGVNVTLAYIPGFDRMKSGRIPAVQYFSEEKDATTIAPDRSFRDFMAMAGMSKDQWLKIVLEKSGIQLDKPNTAKHVDNVVAREWKRAEWTPKGKSIVSPEQLFDAIDNCAHGFSPFLAISIDAYRFIKRDWSKPMTVTGGVLGLHDFDNGTGDPLRFEGSRTLTTRPCHFIQPEIQKFGLSFSHGFTENTFKGRMKDANGSMETTLEHNAFEAVADIVTAVRLNFGPETKWINSEHVDESSVKEMASRALSEHLQIGLSAAEDAIFAFDQEEAASLIVGLYGRDNAICALSTLERKQSNEVHMNNFR